MREFDKEAILAKYRRITMEYVDKYVPDISIERGETRYAKASDLLTNNYDRRLLNHIENKKLLTQKEHAKLWKNAKDGSYITVVYDTAGNRHHTLFEFNSSNFLAEELIGSNRDTLATFIVSDNLQLEYVVFHKPDGTCSYRWLSTEWSEYDEAGNLVSVETFRTSNGPFAVGIKVDAEYYDYRDGVLCHIEQFKEFDTEFPEASARMIRQFVPDRIYNPTLFEYDLERDGDDVAVTRTCHYTTAKDMTVTFRIPAKEVLKMKEYGINII